MSVFIDTLTDFYKACPFGPGFSRKLQGYLDDMSPEAQEQAATNLIRSRRAKGWPSFTECEAALKATTATVARPSTARKWQTEDEKRADAAADRDARIRAFRLCRCQLGRRAHAERWLNAMIDFCRDHGRLPEGREIDALRDLARRNDDAAESAGRLYPPLIAMREAMHERAYRDVFEFIDNQTQAA